MAFWSPEAILSAPMAAPLVGQPVLGVRRKMEQLSKIVTSSKAGKTFFIF
jgi:hypothetical protein